MQSSASTFNWKRLCLSCHRSQVRKVEPDSFNFDERLQGCPISPTITCAQPHALPCFPSGHSWVTQSVTDRKSHVMLPRHTVTSVSTPLLPASWWLGPPGCPSPPPDLHWVGGRSPTWRKRRRPWTGGRLGPSGFGGWASRRGPAAAYHWLCPPPPPPRPRPLHLLSCHDPASGSESHTDLFLLIVDIFFFLQIARPWETKRTAHRPPGQTRTHLKVSNWRSTRKAMKLWNARGGCAKCARKPKMPAWRPWLPWTTRRWSLNLAPTCCKGWVTIHIHWNTRDWEKGAGGNKISTFLENPKWKAALRVEGLVYFSIGVSAWTHWFTEGHGGQQKY